MTVLWLLACTTPEPERAETVVPTPPATKILLVSVDTMRADHLGAWGGPPELTPALDQLASVSRQYSRAYAHASWTKPSMSSIMTSLLPRDHGVKVWQDQLSADTPPLASVLYDAGWRTEAYVIHGAFMPQLNEFERGFDTFELAWLLEPALGKPEQIETSARLTDVAIPALQRLQDAGEPFLMWVHYLDPHHEYLPHPGFEGLGEDSASRYAGEVGWTAAQLGRLLEVAEQDPDLVIVLVADHGEELEDHGNWGHAHTLYDELVHVPLLLRAPGLEPGVDDTPIGTMDLAPTLLSLADVPAPDSFQGQSLLPTPSPRPIFTETDNYDGYRGSIEWPWKLTWNLETGVAALYDLAADPGELQDLWADEPEQANAQLERLIAEYPEINE